jgi:U3 small nucleolar RNA-associated protein 22
MPPTSPKRRKLEHDSTNDTAQQSQSDEVESEDGSNSSEDNASTTKTAPIHSQSKPSHKPKDDESALYAGGLFKSSVFKYQVDYLLKEARPNYEKKFGRANETLQKLKGWIEAIEPRDAVTVSLDMPLHATALF